MVRLILALTLFLSGCSSITSTELPSDVSFQKVSAEQLWNGHDFLGGQQKNFKLSNACKYLAPYTAIGNLDYSFGDNVTSLFELVRCVRASFIREHIFDFTCVRNRNCGPYIVYAKHTISSIDAALRRKDQKILSFFKERVRIYRDLQERIWAEELPTKIVISPALEHNLSFEAWRVLADAVLEVWPEAQLVNSAMHGHKMERYRGAWIEDHGKDPRKDADIVSHDGIDATDINIDSWLKKTNTVRIRMRWTRGYNCRNQGPFTDPRKRPECAGDDIIELIEHIIDTVPEPLKFQGPQCKQISKFGDAHIWKPLAEDKGTNDSRRKKPVLITALGNGTVILLTYRGQKVGTLGYYGKFDAKRQRYYSAWPNGSKKSGYEFQKEAQRLSGSPYVWVIRNGKCVGPFLPGRRQGSYR